VSRRKAHGGRTIAIASILAAVAWLLFGRHGGGGMGAGRRSGVRPRVGGGPRCRVHLDESGVELDGARADLPGVVARCRAAGVADVTATGATIVRVLAEVLAALRDAGVVIRANPDLLDVTGLGTAGTGDS
jgi:hypothetical protein